MNGKAASGLKSSLWPLVAWLVLNLGDWAITQYHFTLGGVESNVWFANMSAMSFIVIKIGIPISLGLILFYLRKSNILWACCAGMAVVVFWNLEWLIL